MRKKLSETALTTRVTRDIINKLDEISREKMISRSDIVRQAILDKIKQVKREDEKEKKRSIAV